MSFPSAEHERLATKGDAWRNWGPYVSDRSWGTVREDYSPNGTAWEYLPHDHARSRAYRWNEDGLGGFCNRHQNLCLGLALWNERDTILKERLFGLTGNQGNHGEDVKEYYFYLDSTPTHSYNKMLYKYPQVAFPYSLLEQENGRRDRRQPEFELLDALPRVWAENRYFDVFIEYAKLDTDDIVGRFTAINRGPEPAPIQLLPHIWFRNDWSWGWNRPVPTLEALDNQTIRLEHRHLGQRFCYIQSPDASQRLLFCENETNYERLFKASNQTPFPKDGINDCVTLGAEGRVAPYQRGTKAAAQVRAILPPGGRLAAQLRFCPEPQADPFAEFDAHFAQAIQVADQFYEVIQPAGLSPDDRAIQRQAFAGLLWTKQYYHYGVELWLHGDPIDPKPPAARLNGRNSHWQHLDNNDVISMPDKWEYPWYAVWDLAFHMIPFALIDAEFAKSQLLLFLREWYMHPNGQIPAYEWALDDVNPPVHAWAAWRVYQIDAKQTGRSDKSFLERVFQKLLLNFTWWVNRKDTEGNNIFEGGFLGLDNVGVFDRSAPLPTGGYLEQADATAWMGLYCLNMLRIALELARDNLAYEDMATKFFEHFIYIANAIKGNAHQAGLWDEADGFFYDKIHLPDGRDIPLKLHSLVGLIPLFAVETLEPALLADLPNFRARLNWFIKNRPNLTCQIASLTEPGEGGRLLLSLVDRTQLAQILAKMLDSDHFLSPHGVRSLSRLHLAEPYSFELAGESHTVSYEPAESHTDLFGGNSNWRGPVWFPVNYLLIESLQKFHHYYGASFTVPGFDDVASPLSLDAVASELSTRLVRLFQRDSSGQRPYLGDQQKFQQDPHFRDYLLFPEYFHGDNGLGLGASHQTGWTALVAKLIQQLAGV